EQTATSLTSRIRNAEGDISSVEQTAKKINWIVASGESSTTFTLTSRMASLIAKEINLTGYVTFNDLKNTGRTTINGGNITTGTIDASKVNVNNLDVAKLTANGSTIFEVTSSGLSCKRSLVSGVVNTNDISCIKLKVGGRTVFKDYGVWEVSLGVSFSQSTLSSSASNSTMISAINNIINWIKKVS
ncbi:MAG: hypothetical protein ACLS70_18755, partial [[Clostridium] symbiosum]